MRNDTDTAQGTWLLRIPGALCCGVLRACVARCRVRRHQEHTSVKASEGLDWSDVLVTLGERR